MNYINKDVAITKNKDESKALLEGLNLIKAHSLFNQDDTIILTPNWVNATRPNPKEGVVVGPNTLQTLIRWLKSLNPHRIVVTTGSGGGDTLDVMKKVGYNKILDEEMIELIDYNKGPYDELIIDSAIIKKLKINKILNKHTKLVSFTQLKQHEEATMSAAIKNVMMSIPSTEEHGAPKKDLGIHDDLHDFIASMAKKVKIDLSIVSANPCMIGTGPTNGMAYHTGLVLVGNNPISTDVIGARLLGYKPQSISYLYKLEKSGLKETDINKIKIYGLSIKEAEQEFRKVIYNKNFTVAS